MNKTKIVTIVGARPQFIKAAVVSKELKGYSNVEEIIIHTGQHYDTNMSDIFFNEMKIPKPKYFLNINSLGHGAMTGMMMKEIEKILYAERPDFVMVYGDTNSTLAGALSAKKLDIKLIHVEAGLRSYNMKMPEEINRILTDRISDFLFCPTNEARNNLIKEGFDSFDSKIFISGDVMKDAARYFSKYSIKPRYSIPNDFALITLHRAENTDNENRFKSILSALLHISNEIPILFPVHPRTKKILNKFINELKYNHKNLYLIEPVGYNEMLYLLKNCKYVFTDSGGLQKEAYFFQKPCITLREETEWTELVDRGYNFIVGYNQEKIINQFEEIKNKEIDFNDDLYGNANSAHFIIERIIEQ